MTHRQDPHDVLRRCAEALAGDPDNPKTLEVMASALLAIDQRDEALSCLRNAALLQFDRGAVLESAALCSQILSVDPRHREALLLVTRMRRESRLDPTALEAALHSRVGRHRRVTQGPPVVVAKPRFGPPPAGDFDETRESIMATVDDDVVDEMTEPGAPPPGMLQRPPPPRLVPPRRAVAPPIPVDPKAKKVASVPPPIPPHLFANRPVAPPAAPCDGPTEKVPPQKDAPSPERGRAAPAQRLRRQSTHAGQPARRRSAGTTPPLDDQPPSSSEASPAGRRRFTGAMAAAALPTVCDSEEAKRMDATQADATTVTPGAPAAQQQLPVRQGIALPEEFRSQGRLLIAQRNDTIFEEGEKASDLYWLCDGSVEVIKWARTPRRTRLLVLEAGACFGEQAFLGDGARHATIRALEACRLLVFTRQQVKDLMVASATVNRELRALYRDRLQDTLLRTSPLLRSLGDEARDLVRRCKPLRLSAEQVVIREGTAPSGLFLVLLGQLTVSRHGKTEPVLLGRLGDSDFFGEMALLYDSATMATVQTYTFVQLLLLPVADYHSFATGHPSFRKLLDDEAKRRERSNRAILRGAARYDLAKGAVVFSKRD